MSPPLNTKLLWPDGNSSTADLVAFGRSGIIVRKGDRALKLPRRYDTAGLSESAREYYDALAEISIESLEHEKHVYRHLGPYDGIVECTEIPEVGIEMPLMKNGDLADYNQQRRERCLQLAWIQQMARTIRHVHSKHVIVADVATRNFLVADDPSIRLCDFTESTILPPNVDMDEADDSGYSVQTDIGQLGAVMYEVVTGTSYDFDLFKGQDNDDGHIFPRFPPEHDLPDTQDIWLGPLIRRCCTRGGYLNMNEPCHDLAQVSLDERALRSGVEEECAE